MASPDYIIDIDGIEHADSASSGGSSGQFQGRPWLAIRWLCCSTYSRVYRNKTGTAYEGRCPRCSKPITVRVGSGGTADRFFDAS